ncbi:MAG TPA: hypothetical protein VGR28_00570 [Candidatus Thermoplasmatota archaeon]|jgi:predicted RNA binding protein with dsRBD fold (UPF0201 family)|nr:hypothetical protein [Candidatus Thermoplasmatota archaeon]
MVEGRVRAPVQPTESFARVEAAVRAVFPRAELARSAWGVEGSAGSLQRFAELVREQRIPDTARGVLLRGQEGAATRFRVSKQAASAGRLNFAAREGPLGDLDVEISAGSAQELSAFLDEIAPDTRAWSLEDRGLTEKSLRSQEVWERTLDDLEAEAGEGRAGEPR